MTTNATWTVVFNDKMIIKQSGDAGGTDYKLLEDSLWSDPKFSNIWAIQYETLITSDEVEYKDETPNSSFADANIGDISQFTNKWDLTHLAALQSNWDDNNVDGETDAEKITRLGARPTSYSS
tara:strand:+ start:412 stop:780 length:369 start_codon:yes stop_codon:yes gene_type:complete